MSVESPARYCRNKKHNLHVWTNVGYEGSAKKVKQPETKKVVTKNRVIVFDSHQVFSSLVTHSPQR